MFTRLPAVGMAGGGVFLDYPKKLKQEDTKNTTY